jgi:hypothetical protein
MPKFLSSSKKVNRIEVISSAFKQNPRKGGWFHQKLNTSASVTVLNLLSHAWLNRIGNNEWLEPRLYIIG